MKKDKCEGESCTPKQDFKKCCGSGCHSDKKEAPKAEPKKDEGCCPCPPKKSGPGCC